MKIAKLKVMWDSESLKGPIDTSDPVKESVRVLLEEADLLQKTQKTQKTHKTTKISPKNKKLGFFDKNGIKISEEYL